jgi:hypothetical protein
MGITALVKPWSGVQRLPDPASDLEQNDREAPAQSADDPDRLHISVRLTALIEDAAPVTSDRDDFGISMPRHGLAAIWHRYRGARLTEDPTKETELLRSNYRVGMPDLQDAINQMLGRDSEQHRPPRLSWGHLIDALAKPEFRSSSGFLGTEERKTPAQRAFGGGAGRKILDTRLRQKVVV